MSRWVAAAAVVAVALPAVGVAPAATKAPSGRHVPAAERRCYGAASRDPLHPCVNPALRLTVAPSPTQALLVPNEPCDVLSRTAGVSPCRFGEVSDPVAEQAALVGDSHAGHWRAAVQDVLAQRGWGGTSITKSGCPFTTVSLAAVRREPRACRAWTRAVIAWFVRHPEVHVVFVSSHAGARVTLGRGPRAWRAQVTGFRRAWGALPRSVVKIVVLRDVPLRKLRTLDCVEHAMAVRKPPGTTCAVPRRAALLPDPAAAAARHLAPSGRVALADLSSFFCSRRLCLPVVGGALVTKDQNHMSTAFSRTLGPYLLREVDAFIPRP